MKPDLLPKSAGEDDARKTRNARPAVAGALQARRQGARHETIDGTGKRNNRYGRWATQECDQERRPATGVTQIKKETPRRCGLGCGSDAGGVVSVRYLTVLNRWEGINPVCAGAHKRRIRAKRRLNIEE